jgi:hypothetical protein
LHVDEEVGIAYRPDGRLLAARTTHFGKGDGHRGIALEDSPDSSGTPDRLREVRLGRRHVAGDLIEDAVE